MYTSPRRCRLLFWTAKYLLCATEKAAPCGVSNQNAPTRPTPSPCTEMIHACFFALRLFIQQQEKTITYSEHIKRTSTDRQSTPAPAELYA